MSETGGYFPRWRLKTEGRILPDERLPAGPTVVLGFQHVVAMFGSTVLAPMIMGFDPNPLEACAFRLIMPTQMHKLRARSCDDKLFFLEMKCGVGGADDVENPFDIILGVSGCR